MDIDVYIKRLQKVANDYQSFVFNVSKKSEPYILAIPKRRLFNKGTDANDTSIKPSYEDSTIATKKSRGQRTSHVTLRDSGDLYKSFKLVKEGNSIDFTVPNNDVTDFLSGHYSGNELFGFSPDDGEKIFKLFIKPALDDLINGDGNINIEI